MTKLEALKILIEHTYLLSEDAKKELLLKIYSLDDEKIDILGKFFAAEKTKSLETGEAAIETYEELTEKLKVEA